jgi:hypothetical protein
MSMHASVFFDCLGWSEYVRTLKSHWDIVGVEMLALENSIFIVGERWR